MNRRRNRAYIQAKTKLYAFRKRCENFTQQKQTLHFCEVLTGIFRGHLTGYSLVNPGMY